MAQSKMNPDDMTDGLMAAMSTMAVDRTSARHNLSQPIDHLAYDEWDPSSWHLSKYHGDPNGPPLRNNLDPAIHSPFNLTHYDINTITTLDVIIGFIQRYEVEAVALMQVRPLRQAERNLYDKLITKRSLIELLIESSKPEYWDVPSYDANSPNRR